MMARNFGSSINNPTVYMDINKNGKSLGLLKFMLYADKVPKTAENFRSICSGDGADGYTYKGSGFHRVIKEFMA